MPFREEFYERIWNIEDERKITLRDKMEYRDRMVERIQSVHQENTDHLAQRLAGCSKYTFLLKNKHKEEYKIVPDLCRSPWCPMCRYFYVKRQRDRLLSTIAFKQIPISQLSFWVQTKRDKKEENAKQSYENMREKIRAYIRSRKVKQNIDGGIVKIEYTLSYFTFKQNGSWHYHANMLLNLLDIEGFKTGLEQCTDERYTCNGVSVGFEKEVIKYSLKPNEIGSIDGKTSLDPFTDEKVSIKRLLELLAVSKKRMMSFIGSWYGHARETEKEKENTLIWTNNIAIKKKMGFDDKKIDWKGVMSCLKS